MTSPTLAPVVVSRIQNRRGTQAQFDNLYPAGYTGTGGFGSIVGFNLTNYPNVLMSGELAFCTDSRRLFIGNINGEYVEISEATSGFILNPLTVSLAPEGTFTLIPELTYSATPFFSFLYSVSDSGSVDWNAVGAGFSKNGELAITAIQSANPNPVSLTDTGTEASIYPTSSINFIAQYDITGNFIEIYYKHNYGSTLYFNTSTIKWTTFA
jgi:hypothetical protein